VGPLKPSLTGWLLVFYGGCGFCVDEFMTVES